MVGAPGTGPLIPARRDSVDVRKLAFSPFVIHCEWGSRPRLREAVPHSTGLVRDQAVTAEEEEAFKRPTLEKYAQESSAYYSTARLWDDGIIDPADTRMVLALCIAASLNASFPPRRASVFRM